jgi:hypothetical protein
MVDMAKFTQHLLFALIVFVAIAVQVPGAKQESQKSQPPRASQAQSSNTKICSPVTVNREEPVTGGPRRITPVTKIVIHSTGGPACSPTQAFKSGILSARTG